MFARIDFFQIIKGHFNTLKGINQKSKGIYIPDLFLFIIIPSLISGWFTYHKIDLTPQVTNLIAAISILGGFLFNLLAIIYGAMDKLKRDADKNEIKKRFIKEIHINISFCILLSIFTTIFLIIYTYAFPCNNFYQVVKLCLLYVNYYLIILLILTLLMVLNRIYILLKKDSDDL